MSVAFWYVFKGVGFKSFCAECFLMDCECLFWLLWDSGKSFVNKSVF